MAFLNASADVDGSASDITTVRVERSTFLYFSMTSKAAVIQGRSMRVWKISKEVVGDIIAGRISMKSETNVLGFQATICQKETKAICFNLF